MTAVAPLACYRKTVPSVLARTGLTVTSRRALIAVGFDAQSSQPLLADERTPIARSSARVLA